MMEILYEEYKKHKGFMWAYIGLCVFLAVFSGPFVHNFAASSVLAAETATVPIGETIFNLSKQLLGTSISDLAGPYSTVVAVSCEPFSALLFLGIVEIINELCGNPLNIASTPAGNPIVCIVVAIFFVASKLMRSFEATQIVGKITLGEIEKYLGLVFILVLGVLGVVGTATGTVSALAEGVLTRSAAQPVWYTAIMTVWTIILSVVSIVIYIVIKTVMEGLDVLQMSLSFVPGSAFFFECVKTLIAVFLTFINVIYPPLGVAFNMIVFLIACIFFGKCYHAADYFRKIYVKPAFKKWKGYDPNIALVHKKFPKTLQKYCSKNHIEPAMAIPVYPMKYLGEEKVKKHDKWWFVSDGNQTLFLKKKLGKIGARKVSYLSCEEHPVYIRKRLWYYEIFSFIATESNMAKRFPKKEFIFIMSSEYFHKIAEIAELSGYVDYSVITDGQKLTKKQRRMEKKAFYKELLAEKKAAVKKFFAYDEAEE